MKDLHALLAAVKAAYPDDIEKIEAEERHVAELLERREYSQLPETQKLLVMCRHEIVRARMRLATSRELSADVRDGLWLTIMSREWVLKMLGRSIDEELKLVTDQLIRDLEEAAR